MCKTVRKLRHHICNEIFIFLVLTVDLGHGATHSQNTKMKVFITDGSDVALRGNCLVFMKVKLNTVITVQNIAQV